MESIGRLAKWRLQLLKFDFVEINRICMNQLATDAISSLPIGKSIEEDQVDNDIPTLHT